MAVTIIPESQSLEATSDFPKLENTVEKKLPQTIIYPESDDKPMAENTEHFKWITTIVGGLEALFQDNPEVFIAGDLFWYPVEGNPRIRTAPDAMVVFGCQKGKRGAYLQWQENNIAPQVVFEILSPSNSAREMMKKLDFYERYGVEEYYIYAPSYEENSSLEGQSLNIYHKTNEGFKLVGSPSNWKSPRLGLSFKLSEGGLIIIDSDGSHFQSYVELSNSAQQEKERAELLAAKLRSLGVDPDEAF